MAHQKHDKSEIGKRGEDIAAGHLLSIGYRILERNWRHRRSEIDLIAEKDGLLIFVEVKTRSYAAFGHPEEAVNEYKANKVIEGAEEYVYQVNWLGDIRFDIVSVELNEHGHKLLHIEDAFY